jgi:hypothetical protein
MLHRRLVGGQVMVHILDTIGRQKLFYRPAAESTRVGINVNVHPSTKNLC